MLYLHSAILRPSSWLLSKQLSYDVAPRVNVKPLGYPAAGGQRGLPSISPSPTQLLLVSSLKCPGCQVSMPHDLGYLHSKCTRFDQVNVLRELLESSVNVYGVALSSCCSGPGAAVKEEPRAGRFANYMILLLIILITKDMLLGDISTRGLCCSIQVPNPQGCAQRLVRTLLGAPEQWEMSPEWCREDPITQRLPKAGGKEVGDGGTGGTSVPGVPRAEPGDAPSTPLVLGDAARDLWGIYGEI